LSPQVYAAGAASKMSVRKCMVDEGPLGWTLLV
jgi:hypothetical protein